MGFYGILCQMRTFICVQENFRSKQRIEMVEMPVFESFPKANKLPSYMASEYLPAVLRLNFYQEAKNREVHTTFLHLIKSP